MRTQLFGFVLGFLLVGSAFISSIGHSASAQEFSCLGQMATIVATDGTVNGTSGPDVIFVPDGVFATVNGNGGNDTICNESFGTTVNGGAGNDRIDGIGQLYGDASSDHITSAPILLQGIDGGSGVGIFGGAGDDLIEAQNADFVDGGSGNDEIFLGFVFEVHGGSGNDGVHVDSAISVFGDSGSDVVDVISASSVDCGSGRDAFAVGNGIDPSAVVGCETAAVIEN